MYLYAVVSLFSLLANSVLESNGTGIELVYNGIKIKGEMQI